MNNPYAGLAPSELELIAKLRLDAFRETLERGPREVPCFDDDEKLKRYQDRADKTFVKTTIGCLRAIEMMMLVHFRHLGMSHEAITEAMATFAPAPFPGNDEATAKMGREKDEEDLWAGASPIPHAEEPERIITAKLE